MELKGTERGRGVDDVGRGWVLCYRGMYSRSYKNGGLTEGFLSSYGATEAIWLLWKVVPCLLS